MNRRHALAAFGAVAITASRRVLAQSTDKRWRIGFLEAGSPSANRHFVDAFRKGLRERGYEEGRNVVLDVRWADGRAERFGPLLVELDAMHADIIVVASSLGAVA